MPANNLNQAQQNIFQFLTRPLILFLLIMVVAVVSVQVLTVNDYDNRTYRRASWNIFMNHRWPQEDPVEIARTLYLHPNHSAVITAPFVLFGPHVAAFLEITCVMILFIGKRRGLAALLTLLFVLTPPLMFMIAEAGLIGFSTGIGLIFLLAEKRGPLRAYAWAMMMVRPQDNLPVLIWNGIEALRQKDWQAFVLAALIMLPTLVTLEQWLKLLPKDASEVPIDPGTFYTLSIPLNSGVPAALVIVTAILLYRLVSVRPPRAGKRLPFTLALRRRQDFSRTEITWLIYVVWLMLTPYYLLYVIWVVMLPVREYSAWRTLSLLIGSIVIGYFTFQDYQMPQIYYGALLTALLVVLLTPKPYRADEVSRPESPEFVQTIGVAQG